MKTGDLQRSKREEQHFNNLSHIQAESWWGHRAPAGELRSYRRAELVAAYADVKSQQRILEIGCSSGFFTAHLLPFIPESAQLISTDVSPGMIKKALEKNSLAQRKNLHMEVQNVENLTYDDNVFDVVLGSSILHHIDLDRCLPEIFRVLRPGGKFVFAEPNMLNPVIFLERHFFFKIGYKIKDMSEDEVSINRFSFRRKLENAGFRVDIIKPYDFLHPLIPKPLHQFILRLGRVLEAIPVVRECAGSLIIGAHKSV
ncbi:MAG: class I SAM-dependent methyltransferase [Deltaproteobacteria bacterium]|nr:class I SAM-dependent methyltransferase [Deltaproteobacteria bacterium]